MNSIKFKKNIFLILFSIIFIVIFFNYDNIFAQTQGVIIPNYKFEIPNSKGSISFSLNGTYEAVNLENDKWIFQDLQINNSFRIDNFEVSANNSEIIIRSIDSFGDDANGLIFYYSVNGVGIQTFNFGLDATGGEWSIAFDDIFIPENSGWRHLEDNTLIITGATSNVTSLYFVFPDIFGGDTDNSNLSFFQQHSVAIITSAFLIMAVSSAVLIKYSIKKKHDKV